MAHEPAVLPRTGLTSLDNAARRAPRAIVGTTVVRDPTVSVDVKRVANYDYGRQRQSEFQDIDKAYGIDTYIQQGVNKYVELIGKHGWRLDCETPEPIEYLNRRIQYMSIMTQKPWGILIDQIVLDYIKYGNAGLIKKRGRPPEGLPGMPSEGVASANPVLGYFRVDPKRLRPVYDAMGKRILSWEYAPPGGGKVLKWSHGELLHFPYNVQAGEVWGTPPLLAVLDDVRSYRQCEEYVIRLLYKHLNPLFHHAVPDNAGNKMGRQEDVDAAAAAHSVVAPDGMIITPPGHVITAIGAESKAVRGEGYMKLLRDRIYIGAGLNSIVAGEAGTTSVGSADAMTATMHNRAKHYQRLLGYMFTEFILWELLLEGGFDPAHPLDVVHWVWNEIEIDAQLARENHAAQLYTMGGYTLADFRRAIGKKPMTDEEFLDTHVYHVSLIAKGSAPETPPGSGQSTNRARPANQHGTRSAPKIKPNR